MKANSIDGKKRHTCSCCLITFLVIVILLTGLIVGGGYWAYGRYAEPIFKISLNDWFGLFGGLYKYDAKKIVTNPYDQDTELANFYSNFEEATFLQLPEDFDIADVIAGVFDGQKKDDSAQVAAAEESGGNSFENFTTGNTYLDGLLTDLKFDFSTLKDYEGGAKPMTITDREFAAILNTLLGSADKIDYVKQMQDELGFELPSVISVKQAVLDTAESGQTSLKLTLCLYVDNLIEQMLGKLMPAEYEKYSGMVKTVGKGLLPELLFASVTIYPNSDAKPTLAINNVSEEKMEKLITALDGLFSYMGRGENYVDGFLDKISDYVNKTFDKIASYVGELTFAGSGVSLDPINALMKVLKVENVNSEQFLYMIKYIKAADNGSNGDIDAYIRENVTNPSSEQDFSDSMAVLADAYAVESIKEWRPVEFMDKVQTIPELVDVVHSSIFDYTNSELLARSRISDKAIAEVLKTIVSDMSGDQALPFAISIQEFKIVKSGDAPAKMKLSVSADISGMISSKLGDSILSGLVTSIMPSHLFLTAELPIEHSNDPNDVKLVVNFIDKIDASDLSRTEEMFDTLFNILSRFDAATAEYLNTEYIKNKLSETINTQLDKLSGATEKIEIRFIDGNIQLPTIYELIQSYTGAEKDADGTVITPDDIRLTLAEFYKDEGIPSLPLENTLDSAAGFIKRELESKMYLINDTVTVDGTVRNRYAASTLIDDIRGVSSRLATDKISAIIDLDALRSDTTAVNSGGLDMAMEYAELGQLINESGLLADVAGSLPYGNLTVTSATARSEGGKVVMKLVLRSERKEDTGTDTSSKLMKGVLPETMYITADIDLTTADEFGKNTYPVTVYANKLDVTDKVLAAVVGGFSQGFDMTSIIGTVSGKLTETFTRLEESGMKFVFGADRIGGDSVYGMVKKIMLDKETESGIEVQTLQNVLQGVLTENRKIVDDVSADNYTPDALVAELNAKLYTKLTVPTGADDVLIKQFSAIKDDYKTAVNYEAMSAAIKGGTSPVTANYITLRSEDLVYLISDKISDMAAGLPAYLTEPTLKRAEIASDAVTVYLTCTVDKTSPDKAADLLPATVTVRATVTWQTAPDGTETASCVSVINMTDAEEMAALEKVVKLMTGSNALDLNAVNGKIAAGCADGFGQIDGAGLDIERGDGVLTGKSIYNVIARQVYGGEYTADKEQLMLDTLRAVNENVAQTVDQSETQAKKDKYIAQHTIREQNMNPMYVKGTSEYYDYTLMYLQNYNMENIRIESLLLHNGAGDPFMKQFADNGAIDAAAYAGHDLLSIGVVKEKLLTAQQTAELGGMSLIIPDALSVTLIMDKTALSGGTDAISYAINLMSAEEIECLNKLFSMTTAGVGGAGADLNAIISSAIDDVQQKIINSEISLTNLGYAAVKIKMVDLIKWSQFAYAELTADGDTLPSSYGKMTLHFKAELTGGTNITVSRDDEAYIV